MRGSRAAPKKTSALTRKLDDELRALLRGVWTFETAPPALLALGTPALDRLLDAPDPNGCVDPPPSNNPCDDAAARARAKTPR